MSLRLFEPDCKLLPGLCKPYPDELLTSWLTRLAYNHGMGLRELYKHIWPDYNIKSDLDRCITEDQIHRLSRATNCTYEEVRATSLLYYDNKLFDINLHPSSGITWILPRKTEIYNDKTCYSTGLMFCPGCLINDGPNPYFRKQWRLATSFVCVNCGCFLISGCPHCHHGNSFLNIKIGFFSSKSIKETMIECHICNKDITATQLISASWSVKRLQLKINQALENSINHVNAGTKSYFNVLFYLCYAFLSGYKTLAHQRFAVHVLNMNGVEHDPVKRDNACFIRNVNVQERSVIIGLAYWLLEHWPHRISDVCRQAQVTLNDLCSLIPFMPQWFSKPLQQSLTGIEHPAIEAKPPVFVRDKEIQALGHLSYLWKSYVVPTNTVLADKLNYEIDINEKYYVDRDDEYCAYEEVQSHYDRYYDGYLDDEQPDITEELLLKMDV